MHTLTNKINKELLEVRGCECDDHTELCPECTKCMDNTVKDYLREKLTEAMNMDGCCVGQNLEKILDLPTEPNNIQWAYEPLINSFCTKEEVIIKINEIGEKLARLEEEHFNK